MSVNIQKQEFIRLILDGHKQRFDFYLEHSRQSEMINPSDISL